MTRVHNLEVGIALGMFRSAVVAVAVAAAPVVLGQDGRADDPEDRALAYAQCIRENGYPELPDPTPDGRLRLMVNSESAPRLRAAQQACSHLAPEGVADGGRNSPERLEALLELARCVRENGVPEFPDPDVEIVEGQASRVVPVTTGMFGSGRVEVAGEEISEGVRVGVPR